MIHAYYLNLPTLSSHKGVDDDAIWMQHADEIKIPFWADIITLHCNLESMSLGHHLGRSDNARDVLSSVI